jgi:hypothetical protein
MNSSLNASLNASSKASPDMATKSSSVLSVPIAATGTGNVLAREAGLAFRRPLGKTDPFVEWLSLMEVAQILCPVWPARKRSRPGKEWKL